MKNKWHTGTLFMQAWKYKWSYKNDTCIECGSCKFKHKGKGLCVACYDKKRKIDEPKRKFNLAKQGWKHYYKTRVLMFLEKTSHKKKKRKKSKEDIRKYKNEWYHKNKEALSLKARVYRRRKKWLPCLQMIVNNKTVYFPFSEISKPTQAFWSPEWQEYAEKRRQYDILREYYQK